jgi:single-stranded-DNA-specific exonuclease
MTTYRLFKENTAELTGDSLVDNLLSVRGITTKEDADIFLNPSYERDIKDPFGIFGMKEAVERITKALFTNEKIVIYSDYDCDGVPGGVVLRDFLDAIGYKNYSVYIPHRIEEGYGIHKHALDELSEQGAKLMITVDLAITNIEEVAYAKEKGIDVIVTDHHLPIHNLSEGEEYKGEGKISGQYIVPNAVSVINSKQDLCTYHDDMLCGSGVIWKVVCATLSHLRTQKKVSTKQSKKEITRNDVLDAVEKLPLGWEKWLLDLVGIATVADMVPLQKENRALAYYGLTVLRRSPRIGLQKLFALSKTTQKELVEDDIAFTIAPRVNAASRMDTPMLAHTMLYEKNKAEALAVTEYIETLNTKRKSDVSDVITGLGIDKNNYKDDVIVAGDISWSPGVIGLIAQAIMDKTDKPVFVWGQGTDKETVKGSCRSRGDVHLVELMAKARELFPEVLKHSGGHEQAGGFGLDLKDVGELQNALNIALKHIEKKPITHSEKIVDATLSLDDVHRELYQKISKLAPFGVGNPKPLFAFKDVTAVAAKAFGKTSNHLEVTYRNSKGGLIKAILFGAKPETFPILKESHTLLAYLERSLFAGKDEIRLRIENIISNSELQ